MAVAMERFSIREYAAQLRSVDLGKCWPFDGDGRESSLPPIPIRKFRWWSDELETVRSGRAAGGEPELRKGVAGDESMVEIPAVDSPADDGVAQDLGEEERHTRATGKAKQRAPKKRSIKELFAVAPPVESIDDEADGDDEEGDPADDVGDGKQFERHGETEEDSSVASDGGGREAPEASEAPAKRKEARMKKNSMKEKIQKKMKNKKKKVEMFAEIKEKTRQPKMSSSINISHILQDLVHKRLFGKASRNPVDCQKKKPAATKGLKKKHKGKILQASKLISRKREVAKLLPIHGILKNRTGTPVKKASALVKSHKGNLTKLSRESAKHVSFSGKDAIIGHDKICSSVELSQLQSLCKIFSDVLAASSAAAEGAQTVNVCGKDAATNAVEWPSGSFSQKKQLSVSHGDAILPMLSSPKTPNNRSCADMQKTPTAEILDLNVTQSNIDLNCLNPGSSTLPPSLEHSDDPKASNYVNNVVLTSDADIHMEENFPKASDARSLLDPTAKCVSGSDTVSSLTITSTPRSQHPPSCLVTSMEANGRQPPPSLVPDMDFCRPTPKFQSKHNLFPQDLMGSICSSVGSKRSGESSLTSGPGSTYKDKCIFEDFIGLPLNSHGELIKLHQCSEFGFSDLYKKQSTISGPIPISVPNYIEPNNIVDHVRMKEKFSSAALYQSDQPNWFPEQFCPSSKPVTSGLCFPGLQGFESMKTQSHLPVKNKDRSIRCDDNPMQISCHGCRENNQGHACVDRMKFQPERNLNHQFLPATQPTMRLMGKNVTVGRNNKECHGFHDGRPWTDKKIIIEHCSSSRVCDKPLPKRWPQEFVAPPVSGSSKENPLQPFEAQSSLYHMPPILPRSDHAQLDYRQHWMLRNGSASTLGNHGDKVVPFRHPLATQGVLNESVDTRHQVPVMTSHPQNICQHMLLSSTHCKHTQSVSYSTSSTFHPPFPCHDHVRLAQPPLAPSSPNLPQWILNAQHQNKNQHSSPPYSNSVAAYHHCVMPRTNLLPLPSPYPASMIPFPVYNNSTSQIRGSTTTSSVAHPPFVAAFTANNSNSAGNSTCRNKNKNRNGTKSKSTYLKGLDHADRSRKRPAAKVDELMKPTKKASLEIAEDSRRGEQAHGYTHHDIATPESHVDAGIPVVGHKKDKFRSAFESCSSNSGGGSGLGPIKLTAGAKHILKPCLTMDQNCPRPIHSTIPFSTGTSNGKLLNSQKKATKVYRF